MTSAGLRLNDDLMDQHEDVANFSFGCGFGHRWWTSQKCESKVTDLSWKAFCWFRMCILYDAFVASAVIGGQVSIVKAK